MKVAQVHYDAHRRVFSAKVGQTPFAMVRCEVPGDPCMAPSRVLSQLHVRAAKILDR